MALMPWNDELALGLGKIDEQHRVLVDAINALGEAAAGAAPDRKAIGDLLDGLADSTMNHFILEEDLLKRHAYPQISAHQEDQNSLTAHIMDLLDKFQGGKAEVGKDTLSQLKDRLAHHIRVVDKPCVAFLKSKGE
jgi:hemerythrin-like metal-binding protein